MTYNARRPARPVTHTPVPGERMLRPRRRPKPYLTFLCAIALAAAAWPATAATLQLAGPAGASVTIDGRAVGFLPLSAPLTLPAGTYELVCEMPGRSPHRERVKLEFDDTWRHVTVRLLPFSRRTAVFSNVLLAGLGPRYLGHSTRGWLYSALEAGGLLTALAGEVSRSNASSEYLLALDAYRQAVDQNEVTARRAAAESKLKDVTDAADLRDLGLMTAAGAVFVSMLDSWFSFGAVTAGAGELPPSGVSSGQPGAGDPSAFGASFHSAVRLSF